MRTSNAVTQANIFHEHARETNKKDQVTFAGRLWGVLKSIPQKIKQLILKIILFLKNLFSKNKKPVANKTTSAKKVEPKGENSKPTPKKVKKKNASTSNDSKNLPKGYQATSKFQSLRQENLKLRYNDRPPWENAAADAPETTKKRQKDWVDRHNHIKHSTPEIEEVEEKKVNPKIINPFRELVQTEENHLEALLIYKGIIHQNKFFKDIARPFKLKSLISKYQEAIDATFAFIDQLKKTAPLTLEQKVKYSDDLKHLKIENEFFTDREQQFLLTRLSPQNYKQKEPSVDDLSQIPEKLGNVYEGNVFKTYFEKTKAVALYIGELQDFLNQKNNGKTHQQQISEILDTFPTFNDFRPCVICTQRLARHKLLLNEILGNTSDALKTLSKEIFRYNLQQSSKNFDLLCKTIDVNDLQGDDEDKRATQLRKWKELQGELSKVKEELQGKASPLSELEETIKDKVVDIAENIFLPLLKSLKSKKNKKDLKKLISWEEKTAQFMIETCDSRPKLKAKLEKHLAKIG